MSVEWHYVQNGRSQGPVPEEQLKAMLAAGGLAPTDLVWRDGMANWTAIQVLPELRLALPAPTPEPTPVLNPYTPPLANIQAAAPQEAAAGGAVSSEAVELLRKTKPWVRFFGVLGMIGIALMVLGAVAMALLSFGPFRFMGMAARLGAGALYLVIALLYIPPVVYLNRYANRIRDLMDEGSSFNLEEALRAQKSFWKYIGMFTVIFLCLYALVLVGVLVAGVVMGIGHRF